MADGDNSFSQCHYQMRGFLAFLSSEPRDNVRSTVWHGHQFHWFALGLLSLHWKIVPKKRKQAQNHHSMKSSSVRLDEQEKRGFYRRIYVFKAQFKITLAGVI